MRIKIIIFGLLLSPLAALAAGRDLKQIITTDNIGTQRKYFEHLAGPAREIYGPDRFYKVAGCSIAITEDQRQKILSITVSNLSKTCTFDAKHIGLSGPAHLIQFHTLAKLGEWHAEETCIGSCGNATDPEYTVTVKTSHANQFIVYSGTAYYKNVEPIAELWSKAMKHAVGPEHIDDLFGRYLGQSISQDKYDQLWMNAFKNQRIDEIRFGYE